jgi:hypothetical protein
MITMGIACILVQRLPFYPHATTTKLATAVQLGILMGAGGAAYFGACAAMGMNVLEHVRRKRT